MTKPCSNCPFLKKDGIDTLGKDRAEAILQQNKVDGFVCHKTVNYSKNVEEIDLKRKQCAGAMILAKKLGTPQPFLNLYEDMFGEMNLEDKHKVVNTEQEFIDIQITVINI